MPRPPALRIVHPPVAGDPTVLVDTANRKAWLLTSRTPAHTPEWTDYPQHDPGMTLVQLFAWLGEGELGRVVKPVVKRRPWPWSLLDR